MDFGAVGLDTFLSSNPNNGSTFASEPDADVIKHRLYGSGFLKQESTVDEDDLRPFKLPKTSSLSEHQQHQMLSFSSPNSQMLSFSSHNSYSMAFPFYPNASTTISRSSGYGSGGVNATTLNAMLSGVRGPFTPSQWMELEHQALIYKYITANVPIPSYLLNPIRKALESSGFSCFMKPNALGWGAFHLGFSNTDPEPGRCRRTDGKKWRCSRDAVPDQKYCERHINRGRHRSRKPVEPQPGHSDKLNNVQPSTSDHLSGKASNDRSIVEKENAKGAYTKMCIKDNQQSGYTESSRPEFGSVCSDSLLNPLNRSSSLVNSRNYTECDSKSEHVLRQFIDDHYPKSQSAHLPVSWPDVDRTQLSISIPTVTSEFMSSSASPTIEKLKASPSRLSREVEATQMGLGIGAITNEQSQRQNGWVPISWEPSIGGPLGEALHTTSECKNSKALNLIENWDHGPRSSFGVIPTVESSKTTLDGASLYTGLVGPGLMLPSLPAL